MVDFFVDNYTRVFVWHIIGIILSILVHAKKKEVIKVGDLGVIGLMGVLGPLWLVILLLENVGKLYGANKDTILWQSRRKKTESVLYDDMEN